MIRTPAVPNRSPAAVEKLSARSARRGSTQPALPAPSAANESVSGRSAGQLLTAYPVIEAYRAVCFQSEFFLPGGGQWHGRQGRCVRSYRSPAEGLRVREARRQSNWLSQHRRRTWSPLELPPIARRGDLAESRFSYSDRPLAAPYDPDGFLHDVHRGQIRLERRRSDQQHTSAWREAEFLLLQALDPGIASDIAGWQSRDDCDYVSAVQSPGDPPMTTNSGG
ncbi:hypothetical protein D3C71_1210720 [compost metagenome]